TRMVQRRVAGLILAPISTEHSHVSTLSCPVVFVDRRPSGADSDSVVVDDADEARTAVRHLVAHGHRRIAFLGLGASGAGEQGTGGGGMHGGHGADGSRAIVPPGSPHGRRGGDVPETGTHGRLAAALNGWEPPTVEASRRVDPWPSAAFAALLDADPPVLDDGAPLPPMWHWFTLLDHPPTAGIGEDGHPAAGPFLPPIPGRRRMFAGGRLHLSGVIPLGAQLQSRSSVTDVTLKSGRSGEMAFVTVRTELFADGAPVGVEEQDIVYRSEPDGAPRRTMDRPAGGEPAPPGAWRRALPTDPVLLSRFSALTYNGHRIHYDTPYVTGVEGYPDLVIHGPLLALLALELPRVHAPDEPVAEFEYRLVRPAFHPATIVAAGERDGGGARIAVAAQGATPSLTATVRFG
ncbi:MAG: FAS1-like dehydratase domain-containing protein, partial [Pseudonocardia sp.]